MNSATQDRAGAASGINNAVARVAGVLAIAVVGIVMVKAFSAHMNEKLAEVSLPSDIMRELRASESKLAGLRVSSKLDPNTDAMIKKAIGDAFVFGFRIVMLICFILALASAAVTQLMIRDQRRDRQGK
jgi:hypothetical protein